MVLPEVKTHSREIFLWLGSIEKYFSTVGGKVKWEGSGRNGPVSTGQPSQLGTESGAGASVPAELSIQRRCQKSEHETL